MSNDGIQLNKQAFNDKNLKKITLVPFGDIHVGYPTCDIEKAKKTIEECIENGYYVIGMGDYMECGLTTSVGDSVYSQKLNPDDQLNFVTDLLQPLAENRLLLGLHSGNHEDRIFKTSGINITQTLSKLLGVKYLGYSCFHYFKVGNQSYDIYSLHGASSASLPHSKIKNITDLFYYNEADLILAGHVHSMEKSSIIIRKINHRNSCIEEKECHAVLTGHYLKYQGSYAERRNMRPAITGSPKINLYADEKKIEVF